jgi:hypothetical protein
MFGLSGEFDGGAFPPQQLSGFLHRVPASAELRSLAESLIGADGVLQCDGLRVQEIDGRPNLFVDRLDVIIRRRMGAVPKRGFNLGVIPHGVPDVGVRLVKRVMRIGGKDPGLRRVACRPVLAKNGQPGLKIAQFAWTGGQKLPVLDSDWWPELIHIGCDGRSQAAFERLRTRVCAVPRVTHAVRLTLAKGLSGSWSTVLVGIFDWLERMDHLSGVAAEDVEGDTCRAVKSAFAAIERFQLFPPELLQEQRIVRFGGSMAVVSSAAIPKCMIDRPTNLPKGAWLAVVADGVGNGPIDVRVEPGNGLLPATIGKAILVREWGDVQQIILTPQRGKIVAASWYQ